MPYLDLFKIKNNLKISLVPDVVKVSLHRNLHSVAPRKFSYYEMHAVPEGDQPASPRNHETYHLIVSTKFLHLGSVSVKYSD